VVDVVVVRLSAVAAEPGDEAELSTAFSWAACPVGPLGSEEALFKSCAAAKPPPNSSATSPSPTPHRSA
jgi:hypothetical protein